ncbi:MAG: hypothetical protein ABR563_10610, partial [Pyrinomonadaceae bacterium]
MQKNKDAATPHDSTTGEPQDFRATPFYNALRDALTRRGLAPEELCDLADPAARRLLTEYGAMFVADVSVRVPRVLVFSNEAEVEQFQRAAEPRAATINDATCELQAAALDALLDARKEALSKGFDITPRDGAEAARRTYADTLRLWHSRVRPALEHWTGVRRVGREEAERLRELAPSEQLAEVLILEERGIFFSKDFSKSILYSVAAPGASQHLAMLAFDATEFTDARAREIMSRHGWFQTVLSDLPHFTFLGVREK